MTKAEILHAALQKEVKSYNTAESNIVRIMIDVERTKSFMIYGHSTLYLYAKNDFGFTEKVAYAFQSVVRKALVHKPLREALLDGSLNVARANRIVGSITAANANELTEFAKVNSRSATEKKLDEINPNPAKKRAGANLTPEFFELVRQAQNLMNNSNDFNQAVAEMAREYIERHDPIAKAERARARKEKKTQVRNPAPRRKSKRTPLTAEQTHAVNLRDQNRCTHENLHGLRCENTRYLEKHHIVEVCNGGSNDPRNLTTLCAFHHELVHQMTLPIEGQFSWIREPQRRYMN